MADCLLPYLEKLLVTLEKDAERFKQKGEAAMFMKPYAEWTEAERKRYLRTDTDKMMAESDKWMQRELDAKFAADELRSIIFMRKVIRG